MAKPNKATIKAFAIASVIGAVLVSNQNGEPKLLALQVQINRAMKVFSIKAGYKLYWTVSNQIGKFWDEIAKRHQNTILEEEVPKFVEYLCMLIPPKDFKTFLGLSPYRTSINIDNETNRNILKSILLLDQQLNDFIGTKAYTLTKPKEKIQKIKKKRDISKKKKKILQPTRNQIKERERHAKVKSFLKDKIAKAKEIKNNEQNNHNDIDD
jgi:hypothetical protein